MRGFGAQDLCRICNQFESPADIAGIAAPRLGQRKAPVLAQEKLQAKLRLKPAHLLGDGTLRHAQFLGGKAKVQMAGRNLEGAQAVQRRKARKGGFHRIDFLLFQRR